MLQVSLRQLLEAGCHFGHQVTRWNPKARDFIYTSREGIHIIDLVKTKKGLEDAYEFLKNAAANNKAIIFVGTKRQAKNFVKDNAQKAGVFYISERWVGGLITNWEEVKKNLEKIRNLEEKIKNVQSIYTKAEVNKFQIEVTRLLKYYEGIRDLKGTPDVLFVVDVRREENCVREAVKRGVAVVGIVDTNSDPTPINYVIPANDDAVGSLELIIRLMTEAVEEGKKAAEKKNVKKEEESKENPEKKTKK